MSFKNYDRSPRFMRARFDSVCAETGKPIKKGEEFAYYPATKRAFHADSKQAAELRGQQFAAASGMDDANW